ncbi:MAG: hypothetical protein FWE01_02690 [Firmicutes bacterium]|nr:hypothetical protein [Bacillota bacterium]
MTYKACRKINEYFQLDEKFDVYLAVPSENEHGAFTKRIPITSPIEKGYLYACLFFFDEITKELDKLRKMINKIIDEIRQDVHIEDPSKLLMELSARVRNKIGDDSLDAFVKEILAEEMRALSLMPTEKEIKKLEEIKDSILLELLNAFKEMTIDQATSHNDVYTFTFPKDYYEDLNPRQRKILSPAIRLTNLYNQIRMEDLKFFPDRRVQYRAIHISNKFDATETQIKESLKQLMGKHFIKDNVDD